ncbi:rolling circle replication-associated protein [Clostridium formicaceticum]|uniref:Replication-associated protein ORF2/G2P domain-containing protein n=1 Tax=Clostridium formicaceticum TaxID=1497 RepID=A0AAC9RK85_9CLOT|nr:hypothetical protein [Clostridium formicaceticum]AOY76666.1 hypothetical protein BJL90_12795 [Clostridium formicaceticum]ARE87092.1 hypothetical protein CLFO_14780 [Clostridium formicaceticum]
MPYREKKIYSGEMFEAEMYPISREEKKQPRTKKEKLTVPKQKNLNNKNAVKHLIRLLNKNFTNRDLAVHLTYTEENIPMSEKEARKDVANYIRRINHYRKKNGLPPLKYIAVIEYREKEEEGKTVRLHHHIVMSGDMDRDKVEELWGKGRANVKRLQSDEFGYEGLARYISKDPKGRKRWTQSKNLKQPTVRVNDNKFSRKKIEEIARNPEDKEFFSKLYPGYILNSCKVEVNEITAGIHIHVKMRRLQI